MGSPVLNTIAEIFLQYFKDKHIKRLLDTRNITFYVRYVDGILIIYDSKRTLSPRIRTKCTKTKFNPAHENNGQINFLDLLLIRKPTEIEIDIF